jgi:hypothetical protein
MADLGFVQELRKTGLFSKVTTNDVTYGYVVKRCVTGTAINATLPLKSLVSMLMSHNALAIYDYSVQVSDGLLLFSILVNVL